MAKTFIPLDQIQVASPCRVSWERMTGGSAVRFCASCQNHVYNLSAMTEQQAQDLFRKHDGRLCVRFFRRADGTVMTRDCPLSVRAFRRWVAVTVGLAAALLLTLSASAWAVFSLTRNAHAPTHSGIPSSWQRLRELIFPSPPVVMGGICPPPAPPIPVPNNQGEVQRPGD